MQKCLLNIKLIALASFFIGSALIANGQTCEWRLGNVVFSGTDPDGAGPANGSVTFTLQVHTIAGSIANVNNISVGWSWQSANAMIPTTPGCATVTNPANVAVSSFFTTGGFTYQTVAQCGAFTQTAGSQTFDRRAVGSLSGTAVTLTTAYVDVFTVTMWSIGASNPQAGYVVINSTEFGTPAPFASYAIADASANQYEANSLTYNTPLALGSGPLPVLLTNYNVQCNDKGALLTWGTATESNSSKFEIQRSINGADWTVIDNVAAAGNSVSDRKYQYLDLQGGAAYYRVRQVDLDGKSVYTSIAHTTCESKNFTVVLYPVPAKENLTVVIKSGKSIRTDLQILDINGKLLRRIPTLINSGNNNISIDVRDLAAGQYLLTTSDPDVLINKKFVVAR